MQPATEPFGERRFALVIAAGEYEDQELRRLRAPAQDVADFGAVLREPAIGGFDVTSVVDESARTVGLAIEAFMADRMRDDIVLVYLSCHGLVDKRNDLHFAMRDTIKAKP